jgi:hypothetical protein
MEKHEKCEAKRRGAFFDPVASGLPRVPSFQHSDLPAGGTNKANF